MRKEEKDRKVARNEHEVPSIHEKSFDHPRGVPPPQAVLINPDVTRWERPPRATRGKDLRWQNRGPATGRNQASAVENKLARVRRRETIGEERPTMVLGHRSNGTYRLGCCTHTPDNVPYCLA